MENDEVCLPKEILVVSADKTIERQVESISKRTNGLCGFQVEIISDWEKTEEHRIETILESGKYTALIVDLGSTYTDIETLIKISKMSLVRTVIVLSDNSPDHFRFIMLGGKNITVLGRDLDKKTIDFIADKLVK